MRIKHTAIAKMQEEEPLSRQEFELASLLWDYLRHDPEHKDRRKTAWGTKTKRGLAASIRLIIAENPK